MRTDAAPETTDIPGLVDACRQALLSCTHPAVRVAAAVMDADGVVHTGVQVRSRNCGHCSTCAEPVALGAALTSGAKQLVACVAIVRVDATTRVWSPCGTCRELLRDFGVKTVVVAQTDGGLITATPDELLPWP